MLTVLFNHSCVYKLSSVTTFTLTHTLYDLNTDPDVHSAVFRVLLVLRWLHTPYRYVLICILETLQSNKW